MLWTEFRRELFLECRLDYSATKACEHLLYGREEVCLHIRMCLISGFQFCPSFWVFQWFIELKVLSYATSLHIAFGRALNKCDY